jgi:glycosyltransferase involved in cell wall biosynthesis
LPSDPPGGLIAAAHRQAHVNLAASESARAELAARGKGVERLLALVRSGAGWHLALAGEGPARSELEALFAGTQTTFVGILLGDDLARAYASADLFVFPSTTDTLGLVLLEARASGLPVVAARSVPSMALLGSRPSTALFDPENGASLPRAASALLDERPDRSEIAAAARTQTANWAAATRDLVSAYEEAAWLARQPVAA